MSNVLIVCETTPEGALRKASLPAVTFGKQTAEKAGGKLILLVLGSGVGAAAAEAQKLAPKTIVIEHDGLKNAIAETYAPIIVRVAKENDVSVIGATATAFGKDILPRAAALLEAGMVSDVIGVVGPKTFRRPMLAGNALCVVEGLTPVVVASVRQTEFPAAEAGAPGELSKGDAGALDGKGASFVRAETTKSARPDLAEARVVVSGGRGMKEGKNFGVLETLTDLLGGAMGASRAATDAGMVPSDLQVGQTGKVVAPELYIAVAISGAIQHLAGMKGSKTIVAINKDGEAPIFQVADYGLVGTWESTIPALIEEVKKLKAAQS
ncbi:MAG: FAD-binding protein [Deltaproteobacteria bacterium]|nr:FAD-binding protein [Deltaproteobacteria bacterium]